MIYVDIGVDLAATRLAAIVMVGDTFVVETRTMPKDPAERAEAADRWIYRIAQPYAKYPDRYRVYVYVENPALGKGGARGTLPVAMIQGAVFAGAKRAGADVVVGVNNQTWKARVVGKGNCSKPEVATFIRKHWPALFIKARGSQDVCDAACITLYGRDHVRRMKQRVARLKAERQR